MRPESLRWIALVFCLLGAPAMADWKRDYALGERALRQSQWAEAERLFRQAAQEEPAASERKRFEGVVFRDYVPQFWAGYAAWKQGACERAIGYWQDAANDQRVLAAVKDYKSQQDRALTECRQRSVPQVASTPAPSGVPAAAEPRPVAVAPAVVTAPPVSRPVAGQTPASRPASPQPPVSTPARAPEALKTVADAWLKGRYGDVLRGDPTKLTDARARAQVHLLRAAARYVQAELSDAAPSELDAVREEVRAARRAQAAIQPDATMFSPRFRAFCQQVR